MPLLAPTEPADRLHSSQLTAATVTRAAVWGAAANGIAMAGRALRIIVVAPYVSAHDYGLLAATVALLEGVNAFSDLGTQASLVRRSGPVAHVLDAAFTLQALRGLALAGLLIAAAPLAGVWIRDDALVPVVRAMALAPLVAGFSNPAMVLLTRRLDFRTLFAWNLVEPAITLVVGIWLAVTLRNVWALVLAAICGEVVRLSVSHLAARPWPRFSLPREQVAELLRFGRWVIGTRILMFLSVRGDDLFVAAVLGTTAVGVYSVAFRIAELPVLLVTHTIVAVALPVWSGLAAEPARLRSWFLRTCLWAGVLNAAVAAAGLAVAPHVVPLPRGMTWEASRPLVLVLVLASFARSLIILAEPYFYSIGRPAVWFWMNVCRVGTTAILIVPLSRLFGLLGVALAVATGVFSTVPIAVRGLTIPSGDPHTPRVS
jgi:PST family polysaccharide transporter/lipopolysaccharide exporter